MIFCGSAQYSLGGGVSKLNVTVWIWQSTNLYLYLDKYLTLTNITLLNKR